jgi:hypothetical protein
VLTIAPDDPLRRAGRLEPVSSSVRRTDRAKGAFGVDRRLAVHRVASHPYESPVVVGFGSTAR